MGANVRGFYCLHIFEVGFAQTLGAAESFRQIFAFAKKELFQQNGKYSPTPKGVKFWS